MFEHGSAPEPDPIAPSSPQAEQPNMPEPPVAARAERRIDIDGQSWIAYTSGLGAYGTGHWGLAAVEAVHFALEHAPDEPLYEALAPVHHLPCLFEKELVALFRGARRIVKPEPGTTMPQSRRFGLSDE